ncbi:MAG: glutathione S-transferase [Moraxellaceae bacterium]
MITLHHLNNSRSQRVLWMLEELGVPYQIERYQRDAKTMLAPPALRRIHPLGKSPVISDDQQVLAESGVIIEYLAQRYGEGQFAPSAESADYWRYQYFMHYAEGSLMPPLLLKLVFNKINSSPMPFFAKPIVQAVVKKTNQQFISPQLKLHLVFLESELAQRTWFAGAQFSAADIQMSFPLEAAAARGGLDQRYPNLSAFLARIHARPAYQRALAQGGEFNLG